MENNELQEAEVLETVDVVEMAEVVEVDEDAPAESAKTVDEQPSEFKKLRDRLEEIATIVDSDEVSLDEALDLYEEAVVLGLQATDMLDIGITEQEEAQARILGENPSDSTAPGTFENEQASATSNVPESHTTAADENQVS